MSSQIARTRKKRQAKSLHGELIQKVLLLLVLLLALQYGMYLAATDVISFGPLSTALASFVCDLQQLFDVSCVAHDTAILYPGMKLIVTSLCTGIDQVLFVGILLFTFFGFSNTQRNKEILWILCVVFLLNILRLMFFYPFTKWLGFSAVAHLYAISYTYIQGVFLLLLAAAYIAYHITVAKRTAASPTKAPKRTRST